MGAERSSIEAAWLELFRVLAEAKPPKRRAHKLGGQIGRPTRSTRESVDAFLDNRSLYHAERVALLS